MRTREAAAFLFSMACLFACTARQAADVGQITADIACAIENAELSDPAIQEACHLADDIFDRIKPALAQHRRSATIVAAGHRGVKPDAGCQ